MSTCWRSQRLIVTRSVLSATGSKQLRCFEAASRRALGPEGERRGAWIRRRLGGWSQGFAIMEDIWLQQKSAYFSLDC